MTYTHTGNCPRCGAPVYAVTKRPAASSGTAFPPENTTGDAPAAHFTCNCREFMPNIPAGELEQPKSVSQGDDKFVVDARAAERANRRDGAANG